MLPEIVQSRHRAIAKEMMDEPCSEAECGRCLRDLSKVNRILFAYRPTLRWLQHFANVTTRPLHIVDVGCGAGDMLRRIEQWALKKRIAVRLTGIDRNPSAVDAARRLSPSSPQIEWVNCEALKFQTGMRIDIVISSQFAHHLGDTDIIQFLQWMESVAMQGWFVSDLERSIASYYEFKLLAQVMRWHPFVRHDGPVSILRSFTYKDWNELIVRAGLELHHIGIFRSWPGRLCVSRVK